ncbi:Uncharacterized protein (Fragment) [Durusdinium trenchii]|uniref:Uncharacterized protein n=1 Tax=Durusdinium trenchii TaxID=1381693 RepID=A0ABP0PXY9_9DINO
MEQSWNGLAARVMGAAEELLPNLDLEAVSLKDTRAKLTQHLGLDVDALEAYKAEVTQILQQTMQASAFSESLPPELCSSDRAQMVYLCTIARVLPGTLDTSDLADIQQMSRERIGNCVRDAFNDPLMEGGGRRGNANGNIVKKLAVFQEAHEDGERHFHVAVLLALERRWLPAKRTLRIRHRMASHWSSSHKQFWSAVRYGAIATCKKPVVDEAPYQWSAAGEGPWCLFEASQEPWNAHAWRQRNEKAERKRLCGESKRKAKFTKLDLTAIIVARGLKSPADVMAYAQDHGAHKMQEWVCANQRKLGEYVQEAFDWQEAREAAKLEKETEWALLCRKAEEACPYKAQGCGYAQTAQQFFAANSKTLDASELAFALRAVIVAGPSKTARCPLIVGPSNSGKTTLVLPFDHLFGHSQVFHKPALNSSFPLVNLSKNKRFLFFDDFRPIEYAQATIDVSTFLSLFNGRPFEIRQSQAFKHGNEDFAWQKGCCLTAKDKELWLPWGAVSEEDVHHMKNRTQVFTCHAVLKDLRRTEPCVPCMCQWICEGATQADARMALQSLPTIEPSLPALESIVEGLAELGARARIPKAKQEALHVELLQLGAVNVREVGVSDWKGLNAFVQLLPFEQRRFLQALSA